MGVHLRKGSAIISKQEYLECPDQASMDIWNWQLLQQQRHKPYCTSAKPWPHWQHCSHLVFGHFIRIPGHECATWLLRPPIFSLQLLLSLSSPDTQVSETRMPPIQAQNQALALITLHAIGDGPAQRSLKRSLQGLHNTENQLLISTWFHPQSSSFVCIQVLHPDWPDITTSNRSHWAGFLTQSFTQHITYFSR